MPPESGSGLNIQNPPKTKPFFQYFFYQSHAKTMILKGRIQQSGWPGRGGGLSFPSSFRNIFHIWKSIPKAITPEKVMGKTSFFLVFLWSSVRICLHPLVYKNFFSFIIFSSAPFFEAELLYEQCLSLLRGVTFLLMLCFSVK